MDKICITICLFILIDVDNYYSIYLKLIKIMFMYIVLSILSILLRTEPKTNQKVNYGYLLSE